MCALRALARHGWAGVTHIALGRHPRRKAMECHHHSHSHRYRRRREHRERPAPCLCGGVIWVSVSSKGRAWLNDHYECMCKNQRQKTHQCGPCCALGALPSPVLSGKRLKLLSTYSCTPPAGKDYLSVDADVVRTFYSGRFRWSSSRLSLAEIFLELLHRNLPEFLSAPRHFNV